MNSRQFYTPYRQRSIPQGAPSFAKRIVSTAVPAMRTVNLCTTPGRILFHRSRSIALLGLFSVLVLPLYFSAWRLSSSALASEDTVFKATSTVQFSTLPYYHPFFLEVSSTLYKRKVDRMACFTFPIRDHQREKVENKEPWGPRQELATFLRRPQPTTHVTSSTLSRCEYAVVRIGMFGIMTSW